MKNPTHPFRSSCRAFSLVEVVVALGLFAFCLIVLISLLPEALVTADNARKQSSAANLVQEISTGIRNAVTNTSGNYQPSSPSGNFTNLTWTLGSGTVVSSTNYFTLGGANTNSTTGNQLVAYVQLTPPATTISTGKAFVSVAWPGKAQWKKSGGPFVFTTNWIDAAGSMSTYIYFIPRK